MGTDAFIILISGICSGLTWVIRKPISSTANRATTITTTTMLVNAVVGAPLLLYRFGVSYSPLLWLAVAASVTAFALSATFTYKSYQSTDLSLVTIVQRINIVLVAVFGAVFLGEHISLKAAAGIALLFTATLTVIWKDRRIRPSPGIIYALAAAAFGSVAAILDKIIVSGFSPFTYVFLNNLLVGSVFLWRKGTIGESLAFLRRYPVHVVSSSVLGVISYALILLVLSRSEVSLTVPVFKTVSFFIPIIAGVILFRETNHVGKTVLGTLLATAGILLIY